jgi:hypothetical protein
VDVKKEKREKVAAGEEGEGEEKVKTPSDQEWRNNQQGESDWVTDMSGRSSFFIIIFNIYFIFLFNCFTPTDTEAN